MSSYGLILLKKQNRHYLHNELTNVMLDLWYKNILPPLNKPPQHLSCRAVHIKRITILKNLQAHQHDTDIQSFVILEQSRE